MPGKLELSFNASKINDIPLDKEIITIGRKDDNDIQIENLAVSGHHAKLLTIFEDTFLEDLNSTNGTFVNGKPVQKHALQNGDIVVIGKHELRYSNQAAAFEDNFEKTVYIRRNPSLNEAVSNDGEASTAAAATVEYSTSADDGFNKPATAAGLSAAVSLESAKLQILNGKNAGRELALAKPTLKLGRSGGNIVQINKRPDGHFIISLEETENEGQIRVNGEDVGVRSVKLNNHDVIEINRLKMEYFLGA